MKTKANHEGQLEIVGIDTPLGNQAEATLKAKKALSSAQKAVDDNIEKTIQHMNKAHKTIFNCSGHRFMILKGKPKDDRLRID